MMVNRSSDSFPKSFTDPHGSLAIRLTGVATVGGVLLALAGPAIASDAASVAATADTAQAATADDSAANNLTEVVVSSDRLSSHSQLESLHDVPKAEAIIGGVDLQSLNEVGITDILRRLANIQFDYGNPRTGGIALRGVNAGTSAGDNVDPSVLVNVDGVSYIYAPLANGSDFFDIESVSVTRGPQGTEGGYNSSLGTLDVTTRKPGFTPDAEGSLTYGTHNSLLTEAAIGGPIIDGTLAWRGAFERNYQDGEYENSFVEIAGRSSFVNTDRTQARFELLATPFDAFSALLIADYQPKGSEYLNGLTFHLPTPNTYANGAPVLQANQPVGKLARSWFANEAGYSFADYLANPVDQDNNGAITTGTGGLALTLDYKLPFGDLKSISAYRNHYFSAANDDGTPFDITDDGGYITHYHQFTQEIRLSSDSGGRIDWVGGLYYLDNYDNNLSRSRYGSDAGAWDASTAQYAVLDTTAAGQLLMEDSQDRVYRGTQQIDTTQAAAGYGHINVHITDPFTLGLGLRLTHQDRTIVQSGEVLDEGYGTNLDPVAINNVQLDGFNSNATTGALAAGNSAAQLAVANQLAQQYFGAASYGTLTTAQLAQVANAKSLRASALGSLYLPTAGAPYTAWLPGGEASLSYKINDDVTPYFTYQRGIKSGATQINTVTSVGGSAYQLEPEVSNSFELGLNNKFLANTLIINADAYLDNVYNFQQTVYYFDAAATALAANGTPVYASGNGNVPWVQLKGFEVDSVYSGIEGLQLRLSGSYNDAIYKSYAFAARPAEQGNLTPAFRSLDGSVLPNAPKVRVDLDVNYHRSLFGGVVHTDVDYAYQGRQNTDSALSTYGWVGGYGLVNFAVGFSSANGGIDVSLVSKNTFQNRYLSARSWNSFTPGSPAWYGLRIASKFY
jgi:outer membrane receptor protein involved in Fe transport